MKSIWLLLSCCLSLTCYLQGEIIEAKQFANIAEHVNADTLVLLDIDDTLLVPVQTLGTDVWFRSRYKHHIEHSRDLAAALDRALAEWEAIRHITQVEIVEKGTETWIEKMQQEKIAIMGLTTQGLALATRTVKQLHSLQIDLIKSAPFQREVYLMNGTQGVLYRHGILFTCGSPKGEALLKLFEAMDYMPKRVVFINDKKEHLQDVEKSMEASKIAFLGLWYSYGHSRVHNYRPEIAEIQWQHSTFGHILSDEEAAALLDTKPLEVADESRM